MSFHEDIRSDVGSRKERPASLSFAHRTDLNNDDDILQKPSLGSFSSNGSLDPYYFTANIPAPPVTPDSHLVAHRNPASNGDPVTPVKDPAAIDRASLVGVGELATPRWNSRSDYIGKGSSKSWKGKEEDVLEVDEQDNLDHLAIHQPDSELQDHDTNDVDRSSPWTIEAVDDNEPNEPTSAYIVPSPPPMPYSESPTPHSAFSNHATFEFRSVRSKPSMDESAGEEILYPRTISKARVQSDSSPKPSRDSRHATSTSLDSGKILSDAIPPVPTRTTRGHSREDSSEQLGTPNSKSTGSASASPSASKEDGSTRRRQSLSGTAALPSRERIKDRRKQDNVALSLVGPSPKASASKEKEGRDRHVRRASASAATTSSPSQSSDMTHSRRNHDYSHLPPSPASGSLQQVLKNTTINHTVVSNPSPLPGHGSSSSVAHSLLRGTQEGWSGMDDGATAEALRKLDGVSGRSLRARASVISVASKPGSRPGTPGSKSGHQWEGIESAPPVRKRSSGALSLKDQPISNAGVSMTPTRDGSRERETVEQDLTIISSQPKLPSAPPSATLPSVGPSPVKRSSGGSTHFTGTPTSSSQRDSISASTSATSASLMSNRHSLSNGKLRRSNSTGSDSSVQSDKDKIALLAAIGDNEPALIPPVPPLPKAFQTPPGSSGHSLPHSIPEDPDKTIMVPPIEVQSPKAPPTTHKTPSKKWSFSALNLRLPSSSTKDSSGPLSPRSPRSAKVGGRHGSGSIYKELRDRHSSSVERLPSSPSTSSLTTPHSPSPRQSTSSLLYQQQQPQVLSPPPLPRVSFDKSSRPGSSSSYRTNSTGLNAQSNSGQVPKGPSPQRRTSTARRLTPSAIPFFRRSSSHSIHASNTNTTPTGSTLSPSSPIMPVLTPGSLKPTTPSLTRVTPPDITSSPGSTSHRKSVLMGLPSLLKGSSSKRSLHSTGDKSDSEKKAKEEKAEGKRREREQEAETEKGKAREKALQKEKKKEDKERSESRISVLMGRKRGKTLSSGDPRKPKAAPDPGLPPMQMPAIPSSTAQRVASLRASVSSTSKTGPLSSPLKPKASIPSTPQGTPLKSAVMATKASDLSLRSNRQQLPTIAGSPSVSTLGSKEGAAAGAAANGVKDTPTKIPRIPAGGSPQPPLKSSLASSSRRASVANQGATQGATQATAPAATNGIDAGEFGLLDSKSNGPATVTGNRHSVRGSPSSAKQPRYTSNTISSSISTSSVRKPTRESSISLTSMRKSSSASVSSLNSTSGVTETTSARYSALSPAKSMKMLSPKMSLQSTKPAGAPGSPALRQGSSSSRQSPSTPSPVPTVDDEEILGDEEMMEYILRQQSRKLASGAKKEDLDEMLKFPEPTEPVPPMSPTAVLSGSQNAHLSDFERKEILDFPKVYFIGEQSEKKQSTRDNSTNNYGYDDDRGDYLVVNHDHLAYRYEIIDTLGKGSFGQVLHCRDHCTGQSVAIKIIRNKKRFHHQALVEIKILDNLRKWDPEEKHHVIKMTENFYFRNHLCIAMELLSINLYELIKANGFAGFTTTLIRRFTSQMLASLALMRHHRIVHCDLKPENILLRHPAKSGIKVIDFGSSCLEHEKVYTYIQSRFYRSPEVILGMNYNMAIDMWSLGCILAELFTGFPIFPGENEQEQLACIMEVLGVPEKDIIQRSSRRRIFFDSSGAPRPVVNSKGRRRRPGTKNLATVLRSDDADFVDFIAKCLIWDPDRRMKPQTAMKHPFLTGQRSRMVKSPLPSAPTTSARGLLLGSSTTSKISKLAASSGTETSKKVIGPPTPLTARTTRLSTVGTSGMSTSVSTSNSLHASLASHRAHRYQLATGKLS